VNTLNSSSRQSNSGSAVPFSWCALLLPCLLFGQIKALPQTSDAPPVVIGGLVGWWRGENNADDSAGTNNGALVRGATFAPGMVGQAFSLDGVDAYIEVPNGPALNPADAISVEVWYKPTISFFGSGNDSLVDKGYTSHTAPYYQYHLGVLGDLRGAQFASALPQTVIRSRLPLLTAFGLLAIGTTLLGRTTAFPSTST
jgi:hypothetical protein